MVERAVEAMKLGAFDYLTKPFPLDDMMATLHRAAEVLGLRVRLRDSVESEKAATILGASSPTIKPPIAMLEMARKAAEADHTTILIQGESGTGKGVLARAVHYAGPRAAMPLLEITAPPFPTLCWKASCSGMSKEPSPTRADAKKACWRGPTRHGVSSMKSAICPPVRRRRFCACSRKGRSCGWVARARSK